MMPIEFVLVQRLGQVSGIEHFFSPCIRSMDARCCKCLICFQSFFLDLLQLLSKCRCFYFIASRLFGFLWLEEIIYFVFPSLFGRLTVLFVWYLVLRRGCHFAAFFVHRSSCTDAILLAKRHFQPSMRFLLFTSIQSSSSPVSISSSVSFMKEMSLSWSQSVLELLPSAVYSSELLWLAFSSA